MRIDPTTRAGPRSRPFPGRRGIGGGLAEDAEDAGAVGLWGGEGRCARSGRGLARLAAQLLARGIGLRWFLDAHRSKDWRRLGELDIAVADDLHVITPWIQEVK